MKGEEDEDPFMRQGSDGGRTGLQASPGLAPFPPLPPAPTPSPTLTGRAQVLT